MRILLATAAAVILQAVTCSANLITEPTAQTIDPEVFNKLASANHEIFKTSQDQIQQQLLLLAKAKAKTNGKKKHLHLDTGHRTNKNNIRGGVHHQDRALQSSTVTCSDGSIGYNDWAALVLDHVIRRFSDPPLPGTTWTLCPNTVFDTNVSVDLSDGNFLTFMWILQSDTVIKCGASGSSENNCVLVNGNFGFYIETLEGSPPLTGMELRGLTFGTTSTLGSVTYAIWASEGTEVTIEDCIFEVSFFKF